MSSWQIFERFLLHFFITNTKEDAGLIRILVAILKWLQISKRIQDEKF